MASQFYRNRGYNQQQNNRNYVNQNEKHGTGDKDLKGRNEDLIIEENTIYEIDRECYARLQKQKRRR